MKIFNWKILMKYRNTLYGICAVWIVFFHVYNLLYQPKIHIISQLISMGNMGVDVFLFLSAVGLAYSLEKNTLVDFYKNRVLRVYFPFLIISVPFFLSLAEF